MKTILIALTFFTAGYGAANYKPAEWHNYDSKALGDITAAYSSVASLKTPKGDCIDCGGVE